ncbi:MAG: uL15 family ribosomal protein [Actinomycetota bacterium]|nr:uL15 family ribosomal protein [Actinomycetota bacterium]
MKPKKRVGRGDGSGQWSHLGQRYQGPAVPFRKAKPESALKAARCLRRRRLPWRSEGFWESPEKKKFSNVLNVGDLERFDQDSVVDYAQLQKAGLLLKRNRMVKVLGDGDITKSITVKADCFSQSAKEKIEKAGGKAEVVKHV